MEAIWSIYSAACIVDIITSILHRKVPELVEWHFLCRMMNSNLKVNVDNLGDLAKAAGMFTPKDLNAIMRAIESKIFGR